MLYACRCVAIRCTAADGALRAAVTAMAQRLERELAQPHLPQVRKKVLTSLRNHWSGLIRFVDQPDLPMDNNQAERALRGPRELLRLGGDLERGVDRHAVQPVPYA